MNEQTPQESAGVPCYHFQILTTYNTETPKSTKQSYLKDRDVGEMAGPSSPPVLLRTEDRGAGLPGAQSLQLLPHQEGNCFSLSKKLLPAGPRQPRPGHMLGGRMGARAGRKAAPHKSACGSSHG